MNRYTVVIKEEAQEDLKRLLHSEPKAYKKALGLIGELYEHPRTGPAHASLFYLLHNGNIL